MKLNKYIFIAFISIALLTACSNDTELIFDKPATERINALLDSCSSALINAPNGWMMQYYINDASAGYNLIYNFTDDSTVTIAGNNSITNNRYLESTSSYEMNQSNGPVIAFNTYNDVLHPFADPDKASLGGDFEFIILKVKSDSIKLKGKRNKTPILMTRIGEEYTAQEYLAELNALKRELFSDGAPNLTLEVDGERTNYIFSNGSALIFNVNDTIADFSLTCPFAMELQGFRFQRPQTFGEQTVQTFFVNDEHTALISQNNAAVKLVGPENIDNYYSTNTATWEFDSTALSTSVKLIYDQIIASCSAIYPGASEITLTLEYKLSTQQFNFNLSFVYNRKTINATFYYEGTITGENKFTFNYTGETNNAGESLITRVAGLSDFVTLLSSTFDLQSTQTLTLGTIRFSDSSTSDTWFSLRRK